MIASDFIPPAKRTFAPWQRYVAYVALYGLGVPLAKLLEAAGRWPQAMSRMGEHLGTFEGYSPSGHDVFVCAYMKSGTTWTLQQAIQIAHRGTAEFENIHYAVPWPDVPPMMQRHFIPLHDRSPVDRSPTGLRVIKTHLPADRVPFNPEARYVAVVRDPKDVCVSAYQFYRSLVWGPLAPSVEHWVTFFLSPRFVWGAWAEHLAGYWRLRENTNVIFTTFEEMKKDSAAAVERLAEFMGVQLDGNELRTVVDRSSFGFMKEHESKFSPPEALPWSARHGVMMRRGQRGSSAELLTHAQRQRIDEHCQDELERLGCDFPYAEEFAAG